MEPRKMVQMNWFAGQKLRYRCREQMYGHQGGKATGQWGWYIYTMEYYSAIKQNEVMPFAATLMDLEIIILSEVSQVEKDKCHICLNVESREFL